MSRNDSEAFNKQPTEGSVWIRILLIYRMGKKRVSIFHMVSHDTGKVRGQLHERP